jgi:hypothetical protein
MNFSYDNIIENLNQKLTEHRMSSKNIALQKET